MVTEQYYGMVPRPKHLPVGQVHTLPGIDQNAAGPKGHEGTGLDYMMARYYSPESTFRFLSVDPELNQRPGSPHQWNRYSYAANNPNINIDPDGRAIFNMIDPERDPAEYQAAVELSGTNIIKSLYGARSGRNLFIFANDIPESLTDFSLWKKYKKVTITLKRGHRESWDHEFGHAWLGAIFVKPHRDREKIIEQQDRADKAGQRLRELVVQGAFRIREEAEGSVSTGFQDPDAGNLGGCDNQCQAKKGEARHDARAAAAMSGR